MNEDCCEKCQNYKPKKKKSMPRIECDNHPTQYMILPEGITSFLGAHSRSNNTTKLTIYTQFGIFTVRWQGDC
jgi:hypothetical protein